jgi:penicillin amidase
MRARLAPHAASPLSPAPRQRSARFARAAVATAAVIAACSKSGSPRDLSWPRADVEIRVDDLGISHVYAQSDEDALFGEGYAQAKDRLLQMEIARRQARGTLAEVLGTSGVQGDIGARAFHFATLGAADAALSAKERPADYRLLEAWCAGVNARLAEIEAGKQPRPYGFGPSEMNFVPDPWTPADAASVGKVLAFGLSNSMINEILATALLRLAPDAASRLPLVLPAYDTYTLGGATSAPNGQAARPGSLPAMPPPRRTDLGALGPIHFLDFGAPLSNNWAVDSAHSQDGHPILCGDPHQGLTSPARFWPVHVSGVGSGNAGGTGGSLDVVGFVFPGTPAIELGHNARVGWTATTNFADVMDLWSVTHTADHGSVTLGGVPKAITSRVETIHVKGAADVVQTIEEVPGYGLLLPEAILPIPSAFFIDGDAILFRWTGFDPTRELSAYLAMDRAKNVDELEQGVALMDVGAVNVVGADAQHITYVVHANVPDRGDPKTHAMPWRILPGDDAQSFWTGALLGADKLPHWRDPARGYLVTANNDPWGFTKDGNVENDPFYYGAFYANGARAAAIESNLLAELATTKASRADMEALQDDVHSPLADDLVPALADAIAAIPTEPALAAYASRDDLRQLSAALTAWDRRFTRSQGEPVVFEALEWFATKRLFDGPMPATLFDAVATRSAPYLLGQLRNVVAGRFSQAGSFLPTGGEHALLLASLDDATGWLKTRFGTTDPTKFSWGQVNLAAFTSPYGGAMNPPPVAIDGTNDTIKVAEGPFFASGQPTDTTPVETVSVYRIVMGFGDDGVPQATFDMQRGASGDPSSPHFGDLEPGWVEGVHVPLAFVRSDVVARTKEQQVLPAAR